MKTNKTTIFNIHEIKLSDKILIIEFYAGDIFDEYSDIFMFSAFKGGFTPVEGTIWDSLYKRTKLRYDNNDNYSHITKNIVQFQNAPNKYYKQLFAIEMIEIANRTSFSMGTLIHMYNELFDFIENFEDTNCKTLSLPILGTGNQGISYESSADELIKLLSKLRKTNFETIKIFAFDFQAIGVVNFKINSIFHRNSQARSALLTAALEETKSVSTTNYSKLSKKAISEILKTSAIEFTS